MLSSGLINTTAMLVTSDTTKRLTISGSATSEGQLTRSYNKQYLVLSGYNANTGIAGIASTATTAYLRTVGTADVTRSISRKGTTTSYSANNIRSASSDGVNYWGAGANSGTVLITSGTGTVVQSNQTNTRVVQIFNGQLYASSASGTFGIYAIGTGTPTTTGSTAVIAINTGASSSPYGFSFDNSGNTCYIADDRAIASGGGIQKWVKSGATWSLSYTLATGTGSTVGARGLAVDFSGSSPVIYATTAETAGSRLIKIFDNGSGSTASTIATAATNTAFRGVAFSPECLTKPSVSATSITGACQGQTNG